MLKMPLNYTGGKYRILNELSDLFPTNCIDFYDIFAGGGDVFINSDIIIKCEKVYVNDILKPVIDMYKEMQNDEYFYSNVCDCVDKYNLSKTNKEGYLKLRDDYNKSSVKKSYMFYAMLVHSFNYQIRFNKSGEYNMPFGKNRSWLNPRLKERLKIFTQKVRKGDYVFLNKDYKTLTPKEGDFVYLDPPYLISTATYNENGGWTKDNEKELLEYLELLDKNKVKFGLSNVIEHKGFENIMLKNAIVKNNWNVHYLNVNYSNSNYQKKDNNNTVEVYVCNY